MSLHAHTTQLQQSKELFDINAPSSILVKWRSCMTNFRPLKFESVCVIYTASVEWTKQKSGHRSADVR